MPSQYTFVIHVPAKAGAPLQAVNLSSDNQVPVQFDVNNIHAYVGDRAKGQALTLAKVGGSQPANAKDTVVAFDPPIQPGNTVTIALVNLIASMASAEQAEIAGCQNSNFSRSHCWTEELN
jgi:Protein of unknown function (DUF2808)